MSSLRTRMGLEVGGELSFCLTGNRELSLSRKLGAWKVSGKKKGHRRQMHWRNPLGSCKWGNGLDFTREPISVVVRLWQSWCSDSVIGRPQWIGMRRSRHGCVLGTRSTISIEKANFPALAVLVPWVTARLCLIAERVMAY